MDERAAVGERRTPDDAARLGVLVADDHPVVRRGLSALLRTYDDLDVLADVGSGEEVVREAQLLRPDVILMDVQMPGIGGVEATRQVRRTMPGTAVLMLTMYDDDDTVFTAMRAGAQGYLLKGAEDSEIVGAIRAVAAGQAIFGPGIASRMLTFFTSLPPAEADPGPEPFPELTEREREILALVAEGRRTAAIAQTLYLSPKTVSNNLTRIFAKLEVADRASAMIRAREGGLGGTGTTA